MSNQFFGFYFSGNADGSANDYTLYGQIDGGVCNLGARYKNSERNSLYEINLDADDLVQFGEMCVEFGRWMKNLEMENGNAQ